MTPTYVTYALKQFRKEIAHMSPNTIRSYESNVKLYLLWYGHRPQKDEKMVYHVKKYREHLIQNDYAPRTVNLHLNSISIFYKKVLKVHDSVNRIKIKRPKLETYSQDEIEKLLLSCKNDKHNIILRLAYGSGFTLKELHDLKINDIDFKNKTIATSKRTISIDDITFSIIKSFIEKHDYKNGFFFVNARGSRVSQRTFQKAFVNACQRSGVPNKGGIKTLRNSYGVHLVQNGTDINIIQQMVGHSSIKTTQHYKNTARKTHHVSSPIVNLKNNGGIVVEKYILTVFSNGKVIIEPLKG